MISDCKQPEKRVKVELYSCYFSGHIIPMMKLGQILQQENPHFDITFYGGSFVLKKHKKSSFKIKVVEIEDNFSQLDYERSLSGSHVVVQKVLSSYLSDYFNNKTEKPDLIIADFFSLEAFKWANRNGVKTIINFPCSYKIMHLVFSSLNLDHSCSFEGLTIFQTLPKLEIFKYFEDFSNQVRCKSRVIVNSFIGLDEATIMPSNHTMIGILSNRSNLPTQIDEELSGWMSAWAKKGKNKFLYVSFGSILILSNELALSIARVIQKLQYPTIWSLRSQNRNQISSEYIFHREWLPQQAILNRPEVRAYVSHCGWGSITEAVTTKTLLVCVPIFADQQDNAKLVAKKHIGIIAFENPINQIISFLDITLNEERLYNSVTEVMEDDSYVAAMDKVNRLSKTYDTAKLLSKVVNETLEFGNEHLINSAYQRTSIKSEKGVTMKDVLGEKWWPRLENQS